MIRAQSLHRTRRMQWLACVCAAIFALLALAQLFAYEKFTGVLALGMPVVSTSVPVVLLAASIVVLEVAAVAHLLAVPLSKLARWCSQLASLTLPVLWIVVMIKKGHALSGLLGSKVDVSVGMVPYVLMVLLFLATLVVVIYDARRPA